VYAVKLEGYVLKTSIHFFTLSRSNLTMPSFS
jgi:hypothetical protein